MPKKRKRKVAKLTREEFEKHWPLFPATVVLDITKQLREIAKAQEAYYGEKHDSGVIEAVQVIIDSAICLQEAENVLGANLDALYSTYSGIATHRVVMDNPLHPEQKEMMATDLCQIIDVQAHEILKLLRSYDLYVKGKAGVQYLIYGYFGSLTDGAPILVKYETYDDFLHYANLINY
jgi:hypothetical protein